MSGMMKCFQRNRPNQFTDHKRLRLRAFVSVISEKEKMHQKAQESWRKILLCQATAMIEEQRKRENLMEINNFIDLLGMDLPIEKFNSLRFHPASMSNLDRKFMVYNFWLRYHGRSDFQQDYNALFSGHEKKKPVPGRIDLLPEPIKKSVQTVFDKTPYDDTAASRLEFVKNIYMHAETEETKEKEEIKGLYALDADEKERLITAILPEVILQVFSYCLAKDIDIEEFFPYAESDKMKKMKKMVENELREADKSSGGAEPENIGKQYRSSNKFAVLETEGEESEGSGVGHQYGVASTLMGTMTISGGSGDQSGTGGIGTLQPISYASTLMATKAISGGAGGGSSGAGGGGSGGAGGGGNVGKTKKGKNKMTTLFSTSSTRRY